MSVSEDPTTGTNQKASAFWTRVHIQYNKNIAKANKIREDDPTWRVLPSDRPKGSLKSQWYTRLQPSVQKFASIVDKTPPASGHVRDDPEMDLYWKSIRVLYNDQATKGLPKNFGPYMKAYFFLSGHPKFASVLEPNEKSGSKKKGYLNKGVSQLTSPAALNYSQKLPSTAVVQSERPRGRDSTKKIKATEFVIQKVTEGINSAYHTTSQETTNTSFKNIEEGLAKANEVMETMARHQVMTMAPPDLREKYFTEVFDLISAQTRNKRLRLQMENEELEMKMKKLEEDMDKRKHGSQDSVGDWKTCDEIDENNTGEELDEVMIDDDRKMPAAERDRDDDDGIDDRSDGCNYPDCMFSSGGPPLDECQGSCGRRRCFHHACNVNWIESKGIDAELRKLCFDCVQATFGEN
jgi:hypothetical protein